MINFAIRNIKVYFRDKTSVFFSLLSVFIIIGLYALFLGKVWTTSLEGLVPNPEQLMDSWLMAGILSVISFTTTMGAFGTMVDDKVKKIFKDFSASPLKRTSLVGGYIIASYVIGVLMSLVAFVLLDAYLFIGDGYIIGFVASLEVLGLICLSTLANTSIVFFITSLFKTQTAFGTASTVVGTIIGFIAGIYMPIGNFPPAVQLIVKLFPVSHSAALFRRIIMAEPLATAFNGVVGDYRSDFELEMGVVFKIGTFEFTPLVEVGILLATAAIFYGLSLLMLSRKAK